MVTRAGKDLLKNTIRSTDYHNKLIQEEEMWRQWELEKGLTMMVTDDCIRNRMRMDSYRRSDRNNGKGVDTKQLQKQKEAARESRNKGNYWSRKLMEAEENDPDRWGHSGYRELYPEEFKPTPATPKRSSTSQSHSSQERSHSTSRHHKKHKKKHKRVKRSGRKRRPKRDSDEDESQHSRSNVSSVRNHREDDESRLSECDESPAEEQHGDRDNNEDEAKSDVEVMPSLSDVSAAALARRREYLKRKLEEFSQDSSSSSVIEEDDRSHPAAEEDSVMIKRNETYGESRSSGSKRLRSHVTVNNMRLKRT